jgi:pimeloyl-ACP methyl ester carboxylesterase
VDTRVFELRDGREIGCSEAGEPDGHPVLGFHGTPGSRRQILIPTADAAAKGLGIRLIALDRPGYGHSTFQPGRRLVDWPGDVAQVADRLGLDRFAVIGVSGGGPHALVCAALLPERVTRAGVVSGVWSTASVDDVEGMMPMNKVMGSLARRSEAVLRPVTSAMALVMRRRPEQAMRAMRRQLPPADLAILERPEMREAFLRDIAHAGPTAARAAAQDLAIFARPFGFELGEIRVPVDFWQGDADRTVPPSHARRQAEQVKDSTLHEFPGEGHLLVVDRLGEVLAAVTAQ